MPARLANAELTDPAAIAAEVTPAIAETVKQQVEAGIDCIGDGEFWTARSLAHYTAHFTGIEARPVAPGEPPTTRHSTRERDEFPDFYADCDRAGTLFLVPGEKPMPPVTVRVVARGPVKSKGPEAINRQLDTFKAAIARSGAAVEEAFVPVLAPGWLDHFIFNEYYQTEDEFLFALADALREEYRAVVAAGFILQIDDPGLPDWWDMLKPEPSVEAYRQFARRRIDAVNHALAGIPRASPRNPSGDNRSSSRDRGNTGGIVSATVLSSRRTQRVARHRVAEAPRPLRHRNPGARHSYSRATSSEDNPHAGRRAAARSPARRSRGDGRCYSGSARSRPERVPSALDRQDR